MTSLAVSLIGVNPHGIDERPSSLTPHPNPLHRMFVSLKMPYVVGM